MSDQQRGDMPRQRLSPREERCLRLVPELRSSKAIAARLDLRPDTVDDYLKSAMRKLGCSDRFAAAHAFLTAETFQDPTLLNGEPRRSGLASAGPSRQLNGEQDGSVDLPNQAREERATYQAFPKEGAWTVTRSIAPFFRKGASRNLLSTTQRLMASLVYAGLAAIAFFLFVGAMLALATAYRLLKGG